MIFTILVWLLFGFFIGTLAKLVHPGDEHMGCLPTVLVGVGGSFIGGGLNWILGFGSRPFHPSGILISVVGGIIFCMIWRWYLLKTSPSGPRSFLTGKRLK